MTEALIQVAHDIRSPLFALRAILACPNPFNHRHLLLSISRRLQEIADSIWLSHKDHRFKVPTKIFPSIVEIIEEKKFLHPGHNFHLICSQKIMVETEEYILQRVLSNILNNAIEACEGKIGTIALFVTRLGDAVVISVKDNGRGMSKKEIKKAFKKGLGLSWSREALSKVGGTIQLSSNSMGTKVSIVIY